MHKLAGRGWRLGRLAPCLFLASAMGLGLSLLIAPSASGDEPASRPAEGLPGVFERAYIFPIEDAITGITAASMERRIDQIRDADPELIIIELDTPGGDLIATLEICNLIRDLRDDGVRVFAWVNNSAYSAGTIIALATERIFMTRNAVIGDCQPIQITSEGASAIPEDVEAKFKSPLEAELRESARRGNYDYDMLLALIQPDEVMYWLENSDTGERRFATPQERDELFGLTRPGARGGSGGGGLLGLFGDDDENKAEHYVSDVNSQTAWRYVTSSPYLKGEIRQPVVHEKQLLTMRTDEARAYGFCAAMLEDESELASYLGATGSFQRLENTSLESAIEWLASPMVRGVLFLLMLLGAYAEFQSPGLGAPGAVALVALVLFLGAPYLAGTTVTWEIIAVVLGLGLLAVEAFVIPGFGVAGIAGFLLLAIGLIASFAPEEPTFEKQWLPTSLPSMAMTWNYLRKGLFSLTGGLVGALFGMVLVARYLPKIPVAGRVIAPNPLHDAIQIEDPYDGAAQVGDIGRTESLLRPAGKARFAGRLVDVVSEGEYIQAGTDVEVVERRGNRVVVRSVS